MKARRRCPRCQALVTRPGVDWECEICGEEADLQSPGEDPPADIDEQLRGHLADVASMSGELRGLVGAAERTLMDLHAAVGQASRYRHAVEVIGQKLADGDPGVEGYIAEVLADVDGALAHGREVLHG